MHDGRDYIGSTYKKCTSDFTHALEDLVLADPVESDAPDPTDHVAFE